MLSCPRKWVFLYETTKISNCVSGDALCVFTKLTSQHLTFSISGEKTRFLIPNEMFPNHNQVFLFFFLPESKITL